MIEFLNISFVPTKEIAKSKLEKIINMKKKGYICVVDTNIAIEVKRSKEYKKTINSSIFNICDSSWISILYNIVHKDNINDYKGPDFFLDTIKKEKYVSFFLGSTNEILTHLKSFLCKIDPQISQMMFYSPPFVAVENFNYVDIAKRINDSGAQIVWVGLGAPKQEKFMENILPYIENAILVGVGAAYVLCSEYEKYKRAPKFMQKLKVEWVYRIYLEPKKQIKRMSRVIVQLPLLFFSYLLFEKHRNK